MDEKLCEKKGVPQCNKMQGPAQQFQYSINNKQAAPLHLAVFNCHLFFNLIGSLDCRQIILLTPVFTYQNKEFSSCFLSVRKYSTAKRSLDMSSPASLTLATGRGRTLTWLRFTSPQPSKIELNKEVGKIRASPGNILDSDHVMCTSNYMHYWYFM